MARLLPLSVALVACSAPAARQPVVTPVPQTATADAGPGAVIADAAAAASDTPRLRLPSTFTPTSYTAQLTIDPAQPRFTGHIEIAGTINERTSVVWLHAQNLDFTTPVEKHADGLIALRFATPLEPGPWTAKLDYTGSIDTVETAGTFVQSLGGASYVFTQHEALYARRTFPCVDEPGSKVPWTLTLDVPKGNVAIGNTSVVRESEVGGMRRYELAPTRPLPSYLVAFAVGPFDVVDAGKAKGGAPLRIVAPKGRRADAAYAAQTLPRVVDLLETWFGMPLPYDKLDVVSIPVTVGFGAMENAGLITAAEDTMLFDAATLGWEQRQTWIRTALHEVAHQWFGDLVTMAWWDDLWLNEGFATWMTAKLTGQFERTWSGEHAAFELRNRGLVADAIVSARSVRQPIERTADIESGFDGITYDKGAAILAMFEGYVGERAFQSGVRAYLEERAYGSATSADFVASIGKASGVDLTAAFASFLDRRGAPEITATLACDKAGVRVELAQSRYVPPGSPAPAPQSPWQFPVCVAFQQAGARATACTMMTTASASLALVTKTCPRWVMPNVDGRGYYRVRYTRPQVQALRDEAWATLGETERRALFFDVVASARRGDGQVPLLLALSFVPKLLAIGDRFALADATALPVGLARWAPDAQAEKLALYFRTTFGPGAAKLGLLPGPTDTLDDESARASLVTAAAWVGRDPELVASAVELARDWRDLPAAVRSLVLKIAVDADAGVGARILRDVKTERDHVRRVEMFTALASVRDPKRYDAALALILDPSVDAREASDMLHRTSTEATRKVAERFVRAHQAALLARLPRDSISSLRAWFARVLTASCDRSLRDEARTYADAHFGRLSGTARGVDQLFEAMDQCIDARERIAPELRGWLSGIKLPRPARR